MRSFLDKQIATRDITQIPTIITLPERVTYEYNAYDRQDKAETFLVELKTANSYGFTIAKQSGGDQVTFLKKSAGANQ